MRKVRLGIIGLGNMGSGYVKMIKAGDCPEVEITAVADLREDRREWFRTVYPEVPVFEEGHQLIDSGLCEAVMIEVPHYHHPEFAIYAMKHGLHVLSDKPAGVYTKQVKEMNEEAAKHPELVFAIMFNQRTNPLYIKMKELVSSGELGAIKRVMDLVTWICGLPSRVRAFCHVGKWHDIEVEDDVSAYWEYPNGATGVFVTSTGDAPGTNRFEVDLEKGKLVCEDDKLTLYRLSVNEREFCRTAKGGFDKPECTKEVIDIEGENPQHKAVINAFAAKILGHGELIAPGYEGINGLMLSNALFLSSWLDKTIEIPFDEDLFLAELNKRIAASKRKEDKNITFSTEGTY